jgi:hypothetical protein
MKKIFCIFALTCALSSCNNAINEQETEILQQKQNEIFLQMQDRFEMAGIANMIDNYILKDEDKALIATSGAHMNTIENLKFATLKVEYLDGSVVYSFKMPDESSFVIKTHNNYIIRQFSATLNSEADQIVFEVNEKESLRSYLFNKETKKLIDDNHQISISQNAVTDPCAELGSRRAGETYGDCFSRNWKNFCCDFWGCLTQISNPHLVAVAIAIVCTC